MKQRAGISVLQSALAQSGRTSPSRGRQPRCFSWCSLQSKPADRSYEPPWSGKRIVSAAGGGSQATRITRLAVPVSTHRLAPCGGCEMRSLVITFLVAGVCASALGITLGIMAIRSPPAKEQQANTFEERFLPVMVAAKEHPATKFEERLPRAMIAPKVVTPQVVSPPEPAAPAPAPQAPPAAPTMTTPVSVAEGAQTKALRFRHEYDGLCERYHLHFRYPARVETKRRTSR